MKKRLRTAVFVCAFLMFLLLMDYPYLSRLYNDWISGDVIAAFEKSEESADCERRLQMAMEYNLYLAGLGENPFPLKDTDWMAAAGILCLEDSALAGWIHIPALDLTLPLFIGTGDEALKKGAGILEGRSLPVGGQSTHACISAHRGLPDRTLFTNLDMLRNKDRIEVHTLGRTITYEIDGNETVLPSDTKSLAIHPGEDLLTLITCTPYGINSHRLYVHAKRCEQDAGNADPSESSFLSVISKLTDPVFWKLWWWVPASVILLIFLIVVVKTPA